MVNAGNLLPIVLRREKNTARKDWMERVPLERAKN
jgi:hypothetical protein